MNVQEHTAYQKARELSKIVWEISAYWNTTIIDTLGKQLIRAADSISANLAEGWNRHSKKDKINFYIIARASVAETSDWIDKAYERKLINSDDYGKLQEILIDLPRDINGLIKGTNYNLKK